MLSVGIGICFPTTSSAPLSLLTMAQRLCVFSEAASGLRRLHECGASISESCALARMERVV